MKKIQSLILFTMAIAISFSCQENDVAPINEPIEVNEIRSVLSNEQLQQIATSMGSFINDEDVRSEIMSYATPITDYEVHRSFKAILSDINAAGRSTSVFAEKLSNSLAGCDSCRSNVDLDSILSILEENYAIYAPYLAENFSESEEAITISWYNGIDTTGVTQGILSTAVTNGRVNKDIINVDDTYASNNPTLVIVSLVDELLLDPKYTDPCPTDGSPCYDEGSIPYLPRDIDCRNLKDDDILELQMPKYFLHHNTRNWPNPNYLYFWTVTGEFTVDSNGFVNTSPNVNDLWGARKVSRSNVGEWLSTNVSFLLSNWKQSQTDMRIVVASYKRRTSVNESGTVKINSDGTSTSEHQIAYTISKDAARPMFSVAFDRCATLGSITSDEGFGKKDGHRIYRFGDLSFYFKPVIR